MPGVDYLDMVKIIGDYYGTGSDVYRKFALGNVSSAELSTYIGQIPGAHVTFSNSGNVLGYDYDFPFSRMYNPVSSVDSNVPNASYGGSPNTSFNGRVNGTYQWDGATQTGRLTSGARNVSTGARVATVAGKINTAVMAVSAGMFLGAKIDSALYNIGKYFDLNPPEALNPATWDSLATTEGGKQLLRTLFHIDDNGNTTMYMPEDAIGYMYDYWKSMGLWDIAGDSTADYTGSTSQFPIPSVTSLDIGSTYTTKYTNTGADFVYTADGGAHVALFPGTNGATSVTWVSTQPFTVYSNGEPVGSSFSETTFNGTPCYIVNSSASRYYPITAGTINPTKIQHRQTATIIIDGTIHTGGGGITGAQPDPDATQPGNIDPAQPTLPQLKTNMPNQFSNPIKETVPQPDGTNKDIIYYPVPIPKITDDTGKPITGTPTQGDPEITITDPTDETSPIVDIITNPLPQPSTPTPGPPATPPSTGDGSSPTVTQPTGEASSLWAVYNPTQAQLDAFGSWLWSSNFVDQIKKLFNDPMQAIVGVHKVFATPSTGSQVNIKCGYIDSECPAAQVTSQYTTVDCGTVNVREYYGNVLDYAPYTEISLYLPFIGIVKLDVADVMRGSVQVKYHVDVITGACLADVIVKRDGESSVLYQYAGSAIVTYPVSSGSYASMVTGVLSLAAGVAGTIMTGGAAAPALIGGAVGLSHLHTDVQKSGGFSGSAGAMGGKKPYLIISRPQDATPADFEKYEGKPASKTVILGNCSGFVKVKQINIDAVPATYGEQDQIVALLKQGVIL